VVNAARRRLEAFQVFSLPAHADRKQSAAVEAVPEREVNWLGVLVSVGERCSSGPRLGTTEKGVGDAMHHPGVSGNLLVAIVCS
jgi:hypothetical protein